jgi:L-cysteine/cystine lyase
MDHPNLTAIRQALPALSESIFMNTGGIGPTPRPVLDRVTREFEDIARHGPPSIMDPGRASERLTETRTRIARFFGADPGDLCFTRGVSDGFGIVSNGIDWRTGDEMVLTDEEHPAFDMNALHLAKRKGIVIRRLPLPDDGEAILKGLRDLLSVRTKLVALSHVTTDTGTRVPAEAICRLCHERGVPVVLDGAQATGQFPVNLSEMGVDFYCVLSYKWLLGPYGAGVLYVRKPWQQRLEVTMTGAASARRIDRLKGYYEFQESAQRFEFGPISAPLFHGFAESLGFLESGGLETIHALGMKRAAELRKAFREIPGVVVRSPAGPDTSTAIVSFSIDGKEGGEVSRALRTRGIVQRPAFLKFSGVRISLAFFNSQEEIEKLIEAVREIARN